MQLRKFLSLVTLCLALLVPGSAFAAVAYDGTGDGHTITDPNVGSTGPVTVCLWFKTGAFVDAQTVVQYGNGTDSSAGRGWVIEENNIDASTGRLRMLFFSGATSTNIVSPALNINQFYHLCFVGQASPDSLLYIDATDATADVTNDTDAWTVQNSTDDFVSGLKLPARTGAGASDANATVAHIAYWTAALSAANIASIADKSTCPTAVSAANLKVFMKLDAIGSGTESSTNAFAYTENGNPTTVAGPVGLPCAASTSKPLSVLEELGEL